MQTNKVKNYSDLYEKLRKRMKWKVSDKRILMTIAAQYVINNKELRVERLLDIADQIKARAGLFSAMKSYSRFTIAASLDINFEQPENRVDTLFNLYDAFKLEKFSSGVYTYLAASIVLTNDDSQTAPHEIITKTKEIYDGMKSEHLFLTGASDYPLAVLLAYEEQTDIIHKMEKYYDELSKNGFRKGNDLQFLSHILTLDNETRVSDLVSRATSVMDTFRQAGIRPKPMYYPIIGMLALLPSSEFNMGEITELYERLSNEKAFKWQKDMNVIMSVAFYVNDKLNHKDLAGASLYTTLEAILQAQQAVMVATITASTAASNASNNGGGN